MRPVRDISAEENFRMVPNGPFLSPKRDSIEPEPVGTIILKPFRVVGYDKDCDGSLMARLENIDKDGEETGWNVNAIGLDKNGALVVEAGELRNLFG